MPQMAPYNWLLLNLLFLMIFIIYINMIYFTPMQNLIYKKISTSKLFNKFNYKW